MLELAPEGIALEDGYTMALCYEPKLAVVFPKIGGKGDGDL